MEDNILSNYPRPQLVRDSYLNLNGLWECQIVADGNKKVYQDLIKVPYSPEAKDSGVRRTLLSNEELWYRKTIRFDEAFLNGKKAILNFGAVDQICDVYVNGKYVCRHTGGYTPFSVDISDYIQNYEATIELKIKDYTELSELSRGKQSLKPTRIWYPAQSGIWQTVWLESVPKEYIKEIKITPNIDESFIDVFISANTDSLCSIKIEDRLYTIKTNTNERIYIDNPHLWSPEDPYLYPVEVALKEDKVESYFGMRKIEIKNIGNTPYVFLNNKPIFLNGVLEQGYYGDNLYTPSSYDTILTDVQNIKKMGFNTIRKHVKFEPDLYYYYCDQQGILVIQDMINGGGKYNNIVIGVPILFDINLKDDHYGLFKRENKEARNQFEKEVRDIISASYNHPSVIMYTLFNEGWGQYDSERITSMMRKLDSTRLIDVNSGWYDQKIGNIVSKHCYFKPYRYSKDSLGRATLLSEYGGYTFGDEWFFYGHCKDKIAFLKRIRKTIEEQIEPHINSGLVGAIYTQYNNVFEENNGLVDSEHVLKMEYNDTFAINKKIGN